MALKLTLPKRVPALTLQHVLGFQLVHAKPPCEVEQPPAHRRRRSIAAAEVARPRRERARNFILAAEEGVKDCSEQGFELLDVEVGAFLSDA